MRGREAPDVGPTLLVDAVVGEVHAEVGQLGTAAGVAHRRKPSQPLSVEVDPQGTVGRHGNVKTQVKLEA